mgnify:FL=1
MYKNRLNIFNFMIQSNSKCKESREKMKLKKFVGGGVIK